MSKWKIYPDADYYFCTTSITGWYPIFTETDYFQIVIDSLQYCRENKGLNLHAYVIMLNHLHFIASSKSGSLSDIIRDFKRYTSRELSGLLGYKNKKYALQLIHKAADGLKQDNKVWQDGFHPIGLQEEFLFHQKLDYIHKNPVRKGYVRKPEHWVYSSARNYAGYSDIVMPIDQL